MRSLGVDLAAEPQNTAIAMIEWRRSGALVTAVDIAADDDTVVRHAEQADKVGIDCPLGWPDSFVDFLIDHRDGRATEQQRLTGAQWRRSLAYRRTDERVRSVTEIIPLSVAADRIGLTAMRAARSPAHDCANNSVRRHAGDGADGHVHKDLRSRPQPWTPILTRGVSPQPDKEGRAVTLQAEYGLLHSAWCHVTWFGRDHGEGTDTGAAQRARSYRGPRFVGEHGGQVSADGQS